MLNTTGTNNTANGVDALASNDTGQNNTASGAFALAHNTTGIGNTANGVNALSRNTIGRVNTAIGAQALSENTTGDGSTAVGYGALATNTAGENTAVGGSALERNTTGGNNAAMGFGALERNEGGGGNTAVGSLALSSNNNGGGNTAIGFVAFSSGGGNGNTAVGVQALFNGLGDSNTAIGSAAGDTLQVGSRNVYIGAQTHGTAVESDTCYIASIFGKTGSGIPVLIDENDKLGTTTSSKRFKEDVKPMGKTSETLFALKPVTFRYKKEIDPAGVSQFGLVAEDVEKVNSELVVRDKEGKPYSVRYDQVNAMLLNEFLKARHQIDAQQKQIDALTAGLQKVSAQLEASKPAPQVVKNP